MDSYLGQAYGPVLMDQIVNARKSIFNFDLIRAVAYCLLMLTILYYFGKGKLSKNIALVALILLMLSDLLGVSNVISIENYLWVLDKLKFVYSPKRWPEIKADSSRFRVYRTGFKTLGARTLFFTMLSEDITVPNQGA